MKTMLDINTSGDYRIHLGLDKGFLVVLDNQPVNTIGVKPINCCIYKFPENANFEESEIVENMQDYIFVAPVRFYVDFDKIDTNMMEKITTRALNHVGRY
jgi:hypothetical protein